MNNDSYTGVQKAAILLITLGPEKAATIFKHLKEDEIEELTLEIANTRSVSPQTKEEVLEEFYQVCLAQQYIAEGGIGYAKKGSALKYSPEKGDKVVVMGGDNYRIGMGGGAVSSVATGEFDLIGDWLVV